MVKPQAPWRVQRAVSIFLALISWALTPCWEVVREIVVWVFDDQS